jgi:CBS domain-containing protein
MLQGETAPAPAVLLLVVKAIIWAVALGSGTSGGVLAPLLIMGGAMGAALTHILPAASPGFWALLAMCATMGGTMRSPLTATFFAVELTGNTHVLFPLIVACVPAHLLTVLLMKRSILTEKIARRGHHLLREYRVDPFALTRVREVMTTAVETLPGTMTLHETVRLLTDPQTRHPSFPVVDGDNRVLGVVDPPAVLAWRRAGQHRSATLAELFAGTKVQVVDPDQYLIGVIDLMMRVNVAHLPVVAGDEQKLIGYVSWKDLLRVRVRLQEEEHRRQVLYREASAAGE